MLRVLQISCVCLLVVAGYVQAQTAEQMKMLESLSPEQRAAVMEKISEQSLAEKAVPPKFPPLVLDRSLSRPAVEKQTDTGPRLSAGSTIIVQLTVSDQLDYRLRERLENTLSSRLEALIGSTVFELDRNGELIIDDYYSIPLAGLSPTEAAMRIEAEPDFRLFEVAVSLMPLYPSGEDALPRFGYDLFAGVPTTFAPATDIPVPADYVIGPGDTIIVQLFGNQNEQYELVVNRDGTLQLPSIGPVSVAGLTFADMRVDLQTRIREQMIGVESSVALGELRSIRVFVLGDAEQPGSYTVSGLSTITNALFVSGGIKEQGSLRRIQLKRNGRTIQTLDLYRLLLYGDTRADARLLPGDTIFVPTMGKTVAIGGEVLRPAVYEILDEKSVSDVVGLAGGLLPTAYPKQARLERIGADARRTVLDIDLSNATGSATAVRDGDIVWVEPVLDEMDNAVILSGHVHRPGARQYFPGLRLSELIRDSSELRPRADMHYVLIRRESGPVRKVEVFSANLEKAWAHRGSTDDPALMERDEVMVFDLESDRSDRVAPLLEELELQSRTGAPMPEVTIGGRIIAKGTYPLEQHMRVSDLIRAAGGLQEAAYTLQAELTRYEALGSESRRTELITVDLNAILNGNNVADLLLQPHDNLIIKEIPQWQVQESVEIAGEVRFPGVYILQRGETLSSVLDRAGGLTDLAFPDGSLFVRTDLMRREQEQIENLAARLEADIVAYSLQALQSDANGAQTLSIGQSLLAQLRETRATGRLVIDIKKILANRGDLIHDVALRDGDRLLIPKQTQEVTVLGEVQYATSHVYQPGLTRDDYISRSGGLTNKADKKRIYVVRANGSVLSGEGSRWFQRRGSAEIRPGDTIVAPLDADRMRSLALWTNISQIIYQLGLAAASANAIGIF